MPNLSDFTSNFKHFVNRASRIAWTTTKKMKKMKIHLPSSNKPLSDAEFAHCCQLIDYYIAEISQVRPYCTERGRDPLLYDRGNVWQGSFLDNILKMLVSKKYNNINRLRLIGWHFSAYRVFDLASVVDPPANDWFSNFYHNGIDEIPEDADRLITDAIDPQARIEILLPRLYNLLRVTDRRFLHGQPMRFGEVAGEVDGLLVNGDSVRYWGAMAVFQRANIFAHLERKIAERGFCRVMEIGPGYGGLAYQLKKSFGDKLQFISVDLVESLIFSSIYLTTLLEEKYMLFRDEKTIGRENGLVFVPAFRSPEFFDVLKDVDLCVNTVSMNEMSAAQVDYYGASISRSLAHDGMFFEANWKAAVAGPDRIDCKSYLALHFNNRLGVENTEVAGDGNLDIWSNALPPPVFDACKETYAGNVELYRRRTI